MQNREKLLAIGLGGIMVLWFGLPIFERNFLEPLNALAADEERLQKEANQKFDEQLELRKKEKRLADWRKISLPPDPLDAQRLYQEWLTDLGQLSGFEGIKVTLERRVATGKVYVTIPVTLEAKATVQELAQFLERFNSVDLLHRISTCDAISPASEGNPDLQVTLTAEGLSLTDAPVRSRLFPQIVLEADLNENQTNLQHPSAAIGFPEQGAFRVRIDDEFLNVNQVEGNQWTIQRGVARTFAEDHSVGATIELYPLRPPGTSGVRDVETMWSQSVFTKPAPQANYDPKLATTTPPPAIRGRKWDWKLNVSSWNPAFGSPMFSLLESPQGIKLDERTGNVSWDVTKSTELGQQSLQVMVWGSASKDAGFTSTVNLRVRDPNEPPELKEMGPLRFFLGRSSRKKIEGIDPDGEATGLRYKIEGAPEGMQIGERDGMLSWTPADSLDAQSMEIRVTVTDSDEDPESVTRTIPIALEEDSARYTYLTTTFRRELAEGAVAWEAYLFDRATNKTTMLKSGEKVTITDFEMTVKAIGDDFVEVERPEGQYRIVFERPLVDMIKLPDPVAPAEVKSETEVSTTSVLTPPDSPSETPAVTVPEPTTPAPQAPTTPESLAPAESPTNESPESVPQPNHAEI